MGPIDSAAGPFSPSLAAARFSTALPRVVEHFSRHEALGVDDHAQTRTSSGPVRRVLVAQVHLGQPDADPLERVTEERLTGSISVSTPKLSARLELTCALASKKTRPTSAPTSIQCLPRCWSAWGSLRRSAPRSRPASACPGSARTAGSIVRPAEAAFLLDFVVEAEPRLRQPSFITSTKRNPVWRIFVGWTIMPMDSLRAELQADDIHQRSAPSPST